jgi:hypothetical protein
MMSDCIISSNNNHCTNAVLENNGLVRFILSFLPLSFRLTAAVNRRFYSCYRVVHKGNTTTSFQHNVYLEATARIWYRETEHAICGLRQSNLAAQFGRLEVLQYFVNNTPCCWDDETVSIAARGGHVKLLQWWKETRNVNSYTYGRACVQEILNITEAARYGHLRVLDWAKNNGIDWDKFSCFRVAATNGHLHILQWAKLLGYNWSEGDISWVTAHGHLHILKWARSSGCPCDLRQCATIASDHDFPHIVQWANTLMLDSDPEWVNVTMKVPVGVPISYSNEYPHPPIPKVRGYLGVPNTLLSWEQQWHSRWVLTDFTAPNGRVETLINQPVCHYHFFQDITFDPTSKWRFNTDDQRVVHTKCGACYIPIRVGSHWKPAKAAGMVQLHFTYWALYLSNETRFLTARYLRFGYLYDWRYQSITEITDQFHESKRWVIVPASQIAVCAYPKWTSVSSAHRTYRHFTQPIWLDDGTDDALDDHGDHRLHDGYYDAEDSAMDEYL